MSFSCDQDSFPNSPESDKEMKENSDEFLILVIFIVIHINLVTVYKLTNHEKTPV